MEKMNVYLLTVGFNDGAAGCQIMTDDVINKIILDDVAKYFDGASFMDGGGIWRGIYEKNKIIKIITDNEKGILDLASDLCRDLNQEAVMIEKEIKNVTFLEAKK